MQLPLDHQIEIRDTAVLCHQHSNCRRKHVLCMMGTSDGSVCGEEEGYNNLTPEESQ